VCASCRHAHGGDDDVHDRDAHAHDDARYNAHNRSRGYDDCVPVPFYLYFKTCLLIFFEHCKGMALNVQLVAKTSKLILYCALFAVTLHSKQQECQQATR
jgi:hypothetical protein